MMRTPDFSELTDIIEEYVVTNTMDAMEEEYDCQTKEGCLDRYENLSYCQLDDLLEHIADCVDWNRIHDLIRKRINGRFSE